MHPRTAVDRYNAEKMSRRSTRDDGGSGRTPPPAMRQNPARGARAAGWWQAGLRARQSWSPAFPFVAEQWRLERSALTYRCGGSAGMAVELW